MKPAHNRPQSTMSGNRSCTVVIPTIGRYHILLDCLHDLARQEVLPSEVIVVTQDKFSPEEIDEIANSLRGRVRVFNLGEANASIARNIGLVEAVGDIIIFIDDDVRISNQHFIAAHLRNYEDATVSGVYGQVLKVGQSVTTDPPVSQIETDSGWMYLPANYAIRCRTRNGASNNLSVRRNLSLIVGGMDGWYERGARREETDFNLRLTKAFGPLVYDPDAGLVHLGAAGGSRSWGRVTRTVPMHHVVSHWYFLFSAIRSRTISPKVGVLELKHIAIALLRNPQKGRNPLVFLRNIGRAVVGAGVALTRILRGPKRVDTLDQKCYYAANQS